MKGFTVQPEFHRKSSISREVQLSAIPMAKGG